MSLSETLIKESRACHRDRLAGRRDGNVDCNATGSELATTRVVGATNKLLGAARRCGLASPAADLGYTECPPPCGLPIETYDDLSACLSCVVHAEVRSLLATTHGNPTPSGASQVQVCQEAIGSALLRYTITRFRVHSLCQRRNDESAGQVDCLADDASARIALARTALEDSLRSCDSQSLMYLDTCAVSLEEEQSCVARAAEQCADDLFRLVRRPLPTIPAPVPEVIPPPVRFLVDAVDDSEDAAIDGACDNGSGRCTLRAAIAECNALAAAEPCRIGFAVGGLLSLEAALPLITTPTWLVNDEARCGDLGSSPPVQPTWPFVIDGAGQHEILDLTEASGSLVRGLEIRNAGRGVARVRSSRGVTFQCNYLHGAGRGGNVLSLEHSPASVIGGPDAGDGNVLADAPVDLLALFASDGVLVDGNIIGLRPDGETAASGEDCLYISASDAVRVGLRAGNLLSACTHLGVDVDHGSTGVEIANNRIGTDWSGMVAVPNLGDGVALVEAFRTSLHHNQIAANREAAIRIDGQSHDTVIADNNLGCDAAGNATDLCNACRFKCQPYQTYDEGVSTSYRGNLVCTCGLAPGCCALDATEMQGIDAVVCSDETTFGGAPTSFSDCESLAEQVGPDVVAVHFNPSANCGELGNAFSSCPLP